MTKEENIATLNEHLDHWKRLLSEKICDQSEGEKTIDALQNAIKALEQESTDAVDRVTIKEYLESFGNVKTEQEPCEDCVSRSAVLAIAGDSCLDLDSYEDTREFCDEINDLPSVTPHHCEDAISRQAVLDINEHYCGEMPGYVNHEIWKEIKALPPVTPQQKWILCKDRMPDYHQLVLTFDGEYICVEQRIPYIISENGKHIESEWWVDVNYVPDSELYSGLRDGAAVAWMPLPLPYKQEVEG